MTWSKAPSTGGLDHHERLSPLRPLCPVVAALRPMLAMWSVWSPACHQQLKCVLRSCSHHLHCPEWHVHVHGFVGRQLIRQNRSS